ncbi:GNAT family N-acetyltransferase [Nocardia mangyaensis]|uniref:GNAT family N-acetyltransferase n=1 Tax=Nocardia mangyaensis TaxID=2213200 RepID=A0A1J0VM63_9NOCA|nr:GNAT family N-acetyltransferase [Nocardia mangyaensis]APE33101.1 GNAT family N-acetyltransferase [Nocardia mangyaensis]
MYEHTLTDGTVWLTRPTGADIDRIVECCQDPEVQRWVTIPVPYHRSDAESFLDKAVAPGWAGDTPVWAVRTAEDGQVEGMIGLHDRGADMCEIGFWLTPEHRGRGLMSRAVALVCDFGFAPDGLALARIAWRAFVGNHPSAAVARRNGFQYEGLARSASVQRGVRVDEWRAARLPTDPPGPADWPQHVLPG